MSLQNVPVFATFPSCRLYGVLVQSQSSLKDKTDESAIARSYQVGWIDYTLQDILGQKF